MSDDVQPLALHLAGIAKRDAPEGWSIPSTVPLLIDFDDRRWLALAELSRGDDGHLHAEATLVGPDRATLARVMARRVFAVRCQVLVTGTDCARVLAVSVGDCNVDPGLPRYAVTVTGGTELERAFVRKLDALPWPTAMHPYLRRVHVRRDAIGLWFWYHPHCRAAAAQIETYERALGSALEHAAGFPCPKPVRSYAKHLEVTPTSRNGWSSWLCPGDRQYCASDNPCDCCSDDAGRSEQ